MKFYIFTQVLIFMIFLHFDLSSSMRSNYQPTSPPRILEPLPARLALDPVTKKLVGIWFNGKLEPPNFRALGIPPRSPDRVQHAVTFVYRGPRSTPVGVFKGHQTYVYRPSD
ncbi:uncharacterized protein LOC117168896 isoform X2 [Belonocnema kinseyi]|uniref:uncharacterized protein LOC117168896 isoform X2 n=1 Tax=Belonocnema kinseyi TaxID=2817044 RepID=UPI00143CC17C|nr:uncharacterized protein LOC117168896 isoform X2 [Belonocnema kinseyi]